MKWWTNIAEKTQLCADTGDYRGFYEALKAVYGPSHQVVSPLRSTDGQALLTDKASILNRWAEHFQTLFSADRSVNESAIQQIPQQPVKEELDEAPTLEEVIKATSQLKCGKAAGVDGIPPEIWKHGGAALHSKLYDLFLCCWEQESYRKTSVTLLSSPCTRTKGKSLTAQTTGDNSPLHRSQNPSKSSPQQTVPAVAELHLPESQCGFRSNRGTTDMVFVLRQLQRKMP